ncbi:hypothetical protein EPO33_02370 [Patescibacteria group bacterium]|nr:MAG: hypothetical protein EPO33_02370 [Patescibacteria group bacterium]
MKFPVLIALLVVLAAGGIGGGIWYTNTQPGALDGFASCLGEKGAKFYGAFWCPHCANQKKLFGKSAKKLPYIECGVAGNTSAQTQVCTDAEVKGYPTWVFADASRLSGEIPLQTLAEKTGCALPS